MVKKLIYLAGAMVLLATVAVGIFLYTRATVGAEVYVYRFNTRYSGLVRERRVVAYAEPETMVQSVFRLMADTPRGGGLQQTAPAGLVADMVYIRGNVMEILFPAEYNDMAPYEEALFRASLIRTMTGLSFINIEGIRILVDGEELTDPFGESLGIQTADRVVISPDIMPRRVFPHTLILYFVSADMDGLAQEEREVERPDGVSLEQVIIEELISGPAFDGSIATIHADTRILDIVTEGFTSSINFSAEFADNFQFTQSVAELTLQSIVRSVMENISIVNNVQFLIESELRGDFRGVPYFDTPFERE